MPEERAKANLRMALYNLQNLFPGYLAITRTTASFNRERPYWLDLEAFHSRLAAAEGQAAGLRAAMELYRGDFLEDLYVESAPDFDAWLVEQREHLRLSFGQGLERLAEHYANQGDWIASVEGYRRLLALDALREDIHRRLMLILARAGRYDSALAQYEICCRLLREELGVEPAPETTALYLRIQIARSRPRPHNLPLETADIIGREAELGKIASLLGESACRLITLVGPGGIGKTDLALHAAADKSREGMFLEGVYFVPLASVSSSDLLAAAIADAIQLAFQGPADPKVQLLQYLRNKEMLLVLDNFEHLNEGGARFVMDILAKTADVKLLVTSRERLSLREEWLLEIQGLRFPRSSSDSSRHGMIIAEEAENYAAMRLFTDRARRVQSDFSLSETERAAVARICQLVDGIPLGIELAASQARTLSFKKIAEEIERGLGVLATSFRDVPDRHRSMQAVFDQSWGLLSAVERNVFKKSSVFRGGFTRDAAQQVAGASLPVLSALVDKSFLHRDPSGRYEVHELLRQYAEEKLRAVHQEWENAQNLHCGYFASFLQHMEHQLKGGKQVEALQDLGAEIDNLRAAWRSAVDGRRMEEIGKALEGLFVFYELRDWFREGEETFRNAASRLGEVGEEPVDAGLGSTIVLGAILVRWGWFCWRLGRFRESSEILRESLQVLGQGGSGARREMGLALVQLGMVRWHLGDYEESQHFMRDGLDISREVRDQFIQSLSLMALSLVTHSMGKYAEAKQWQEECLAQFRMNNDQRGLVSSMVWSGGRIHLALGEFEQGEHLLNEGMTIWQGLKDNFHRALALTHLGILAYLRTDYSKAKQLHQESMEIFKEIGDQWGVAYALNGLGYATGALGERDAAENHFCEALKIAFEIETLPVAMEALVGLATLLHTGNQRETERALEWLEFVRQHPASSYETKVKAEQLITEIEEMLPARVVKAAQSRGQADKLEVLVEEILGKSSLQ
jgi:predicted ATPase/DNA-binding SARP family transcriptional activator